MKALVATLPLALLTLPSVHAAQPAVPAEWHGTLPHDGAVAQLQQWWAQFDDPLLQRLIAAAQSESADLASASARIADARAQRTAARAALLPSADVGASVTRGRSELGDPVATTAAASAQMAWELDLFGGNRAGARAAQARLQATEAGWHEARVALAAETANSYVALRACQARLVQTEIDVASREETARLTAESARFGMQTPGNVALARASAAQARASATQQRKQCETSINALVAVTGFDPSGLRAELAASTARMPRPAQIAVDTVPARALAQRPDLHAAERNVVAAAGDVKHADAQRHPRLTLRGSVGPAHARTSFGSADGTVWSFGPLSLVLPIFDGGQRRANAAAARVHYDEAVVSYRARLRQAVREVEDALLALDSTAGRAEDARIAAEGFRSSLQATDARYRGGLASLFELEEARRSDVQSQIALIDLEQERVQAWITLYRALGGGWQSAAPLSPTPEIPA